MAAPVGNAKVSEFAAESDLFGHHNWLNGILSRFQQYFSQITATAHIIHVFPGFHQY